MKKTLTLLLLSLCNFLYASQSSSYWNEITKEQALQSGRQDITTINCRHFQLDLQALKNLLLTAPMEFTASAVSKPLYIDLPMPDGNFQRFSIVETQVCAPELAAKYPENKTWAGKGVDDPTATIRLDVTYWGFHAMVLAADHVFFIDPYNQQTTSQYICFYKSDAVKSAPTVCAFDEKHEWNVEQTEKAKAIRESNSNNGVARSAGASLRNYRLALACSGEYAAVFGTTVPPVHAAMVTSVNRVVGVYDKELAIRMTLIPNNDTLIFFTIGTPYSNFSPNTLLTENQTTITNRIGAANYDIGHVFTTGGGGVAGLGVVCQNSQKARGETGLPNPVGDGYDIDFVAHEMGHQFGGNHTFNSVTGNCGGGNRAAVSAYEPGSGITIMAYAGICGSDDLAAHSIPYFHTRSFDEIQDYTTFSSGSTCPVTTASGNTPPTSGLTVYHYDIPVNTPFKLTGAGTDVDAGDTVRFSWEQYDLHSVGSTWNNPPAGSNSPIFMSYAPSLSGVRLFPKLTNILNNTNSKGELKPSYARTLNFRLTLRDNQTMGGGVTYDDQTVEVNVVGTGTPFAITYPNTTGISWNGGSSQTITWDVSGSTAAPINSPNVNIYLSTTGGTTYPFPTLIASGVPNNGSYTFTVPNTPTSTARILIESANNIFFDINDKNFAISPAGIEEEINNESISINPNPSQDIVQFILSGDLRGDINVKLMDARGRVVVNALYNKVQEGLVETMDISKLENGVYIVSFVTDKGTATRRLVKN